MSFHKKRSISISLIAVNTCNYFCNLLYCLINTPKRLDYIFYKCSVLHYSVIYVLHFSCTQFCTFSILQDIRLFIRDIILYSMATSNTNIHCMNILIFFLRSNLPHTKRTDKELEKNDPLEQGGHCCRAICP